MENDGHQEEQIYRRTDHWVLAASRSRHADQGVVLQRRLQQCHFLKWRAEYGSLESSDAANPYQIELMKNVVS